MNAEPPRPRRSTYSEMPVAYAAVGASKDADLLRFPPAGTTPFEEAVRLGSGQERFVLSTSLLMTWGAQRRAGYEITNLVAGDGGKYTGVEFDVQGRPKPGVEPEDHFGPDGEPFLTAGTTLTSTLKGKGKGRSQLVVFTLSEPRRAGFAWGTTDPSGVIGEELFTIEHRSDDSVWAVARGFFSAPSNGVLGIKGRTLVKNAIIAAKEQIDSLAPGAVADREAAANEADGGGSASPSPTVRVLQPGEAADPEQDHDQEWGSDSGREPNVETAVIELPDLSEADDGATDDGATNNPVER